MEIKECGKYLRVDANGFIQNDASIENIIFPWRQLVDELISLYKAELGNSLQSIYRNLSI